MLAIRFHQTHLYCSLHCSCITWLKTVWFKSRKDSYLIFYKILKSQNNCPNPTVEISSLIYESIKVFKFCELLAPWLQSMCIQYHKLGKLLLQLTDPACSSIVYSISHRMTMTITEWELICFYPEALRVHIQIIIQHIVEFFYYT